MKTITLGDFLNDQQLNRALKLKKASLICEYIIKPNIDTINKKLGQENDPMYLSYMIEYAITHHTR